MKVLLLSRYGPLGGSSRVRLYQYLPYLESQGIHVTVSSFFDDKYVRNLYAGKGRGMDVVKAYLRRLLLMMKSRRFDLLWIEKEVFPWLTAWVEWILDELHIPYVVDFDDAIFHRYDLHGNPIIRSVLGQKIDGVMRRATMVIAGNDYLAARAQQAGAKRIAILPSVVDLDRYGKIEKVSNQTFTIGWIGSPLTARYLHLVQPALAEVCKDGHARLVLVGGDNFDLEGVPLVRRPWSEETEVAEIGGFDVGIMPLADGPWERGKCGYKLVQYMACGLPVVASPVGMNLKIVEEGENGFLGATNEEWVRALTALRESKQLRDRMGQAGRRKVEAEFSLQVTAPQLVALFRAAVTS